jgi:3',5'-cyclic AMP phosphodiesterase CpdA
MNAFKRITKLFLLCLGLLFSCDNPFSYSPFEVRLPTELRNTTEKNLQRIAQLNYPSDSTLKIALLSDPHYHFNDLKDALDRINDREDIAFIIVTGDLTENGLQKEFELFHGLMAGSKKPYLTVIGNHDYLSNGGKVYEQMFGQFNYAFTFQGVKFVMWDNVAWESNKAADWNWLKHSLQHKRSDEDRAIFHHTIPFSHIPPFDKQLSDSANVFHELLRENNVEISVHGHKHEYTNDELFGGGVRYVTVGSPQKRAFAELIIATDEVKIEKIEY